MTQGPLSGVEREFIELAIQTTLPINEIARRINRSYHQVYHHIRINKLHRKKLKAWKESEIAYVKMSAGKVPIGHIAKVLGRSYHSVTGKMRHLGISTDDRRKWTHKEDDLLYDCAGTMRMEDMAKKLGVTRCAVEHRSNRLGIKWNQGIVTRRGIARAIGVSERTVKRYTELLNNRSMGIKNGKISILAIPIIAQAILDNPIATGRCNASLKQLEKAAAGEWDDLEVWEVGKEELSQVPESHSHMSMWESGV